MLFCCFQCVILRLSVLGLGFDLPSAEFSGYHGWEFSEAQRFCCQNLSTQLKVKGEATAWRFEQYYLDRDHVVAVALGPIKDAVPEYKEVLPLKDLSEEEIAAAPSHADPVNSFQVLSQDDLADFLD